MISRGQFYFLTVNFMLGTTLFVTINNMIEEAGPDAWMMPLWAGLGGMLAALLWIALLRCAPGRSPVEIARDAWGPIAGLIVGILYLLVFCTIAAWVLRNLSDFMNVTIMPKTPPTIFHIMFLLVGAYAVAQGSETVGRMNAVITPFLFFPFWLSLALAAEEWKWERLEPAFRDPWAFFQYPSLLAFPFLEAFALTMFWPKVRPGAAGALVSGIASAAVSLSLVLFMVTGLLGPERAARINFPIYTIVQEVSIGRVLVIIHSVLTVTLITLIFVKLLVLLYAAFETIDRLFRPTVRWPHLLALAILISAGARTVYENPVQNRLLIDRYLLIYDGFYSVLIPALLLVTIWIRRSLAGRARKG